MFSAAADSVDIDVLLHPGPGDLNGCLIDVAGGPLGVLEHSDPEEIREPQHHHLEDCSAFPNLHPRDKKMPTLCY